MVYDEPEDFPDPLQNRERLQTQLDLLRKELTKAAKTQGLKLQDSFFTELGNYGSHSGVGSLPDKSLNVVLRSIGEKALRYAKEAEDPDILAVLDPSGRKAGGGLIRITIHKLCDDPFSDCSSAARRILDRSRP